MNRQALAAIPAALCLTFSPVSARGIAMRFVDITLEKVDPGVSFNLRTLKSLPLVVVNQDAVEPVDVMVETVIPDGNEMKEGYEPIPNPSWIQIVPNRFRLGPKASASSDVVVTIPEDPKYVGHHYEAIIWAHTETRNKAQSGGVVFETGLRTRFRLSIGTMGPASLQREKALKKLATINTNFNIAPDSLYLSDPIPVGKTVNLKVERKAAFKVVNQSDDPVELKLSAAPADPNMLPQAGYVDAPDHKWLTIEPEKVSVEGNAIKQVVLKVTIPDKPEYRNKKYMFVVQTTLADESLPLAYKNSLYITTLP